MIKRTSLLVLIILLISNIAFPQVSQEDSTTAKITEIIKSIRTENNLPSISISIVHGNDIIYKKALGYTDLENQALASTDSKYPIMSISKIFTALLYVQMVERGQVSLNDNVQKYIPKYSVKSEFPEKHKTSLLQLATHESGLPRECPANAKFILSHYQFVESIGKSTLINPCPEETFIKSLSNIELEHKPFEYQQYSSYYSNVGYELLGIALEKASGEDYAKIMAKNIFEPLGMYQTGFVENNLDRNKLDLPKGYILDQNTGKHIVTPYLLTDSYYHCGGMYSTTEDLARFLISYFDYDTCYENQIISPDAIRMMRKLNIGWSFQWYQEYPMIGHGGSYLGYRSYIALIPELKLGWIVFTNQYDYKNSIDFGELNNTLRNILIPLVSYSSSSEKELLSLASFIGTYYVQDKSQKIKIYIENGALKYYNVLYSSKDNTLKRKGNLKFVESTGFNYNFNFLIDNNEISILKMGDLIWYKE